MKAYLQKIDEPGKYTDYADYAAFPPFDATDGFQWVEGELPDDIHPHIVLSLSQKLQMLFMSLSTAYRAQFYLIASAVDTALEKNNDVAGAIALIQGLNVPVELQAEQQQMIALLEGLV